MGTHEDGAVVTDYKGAWSPFSGGHHVNNLSFSRAPLGSEAPLGKTGSAARR